MAAALIDQANKEFNDVINLLTKVEQIQKEGQYDNTSTATPEQLDTRLSKSIIHEKSQRENKEVYNQQILELEEGIIQLICNQSLQADETESNLIVFQIINEIRTQKLHLLNRISEYLERSIAEQQLEEFTDELVERPHNDQIVSQQTLLRLEQTINEEFECISANKYDDIVETQLQLNQEQLKQQIIDQSGKRELSIDDRHITLLDNIETQQKFRRQVRDVFGRGKLDQDNHFFNFYKFELMEDHPIPPREIRNCQVVNVNNIEELIQQNIRLRPRFDTMLNRIVANFTLAVLRQVLNELQEQSAMVDIKAFENTLLGKLFDMGDLAQINEYLEKLNTVCENDELGSQLIYIFVKLSELRTVKMALQCEVDQRSLKKTILAEINQLSDVDQLTEQIYYLMEGNPEVNQCDIDLVENVLEQFTSQRSAASNSADLQQNSQILFENTAYSRSLVSALNSQANVTRRSQLSNKNIRLTEEIVGQPREATKFGQMMNNIAVYNLRLKDECFNINELTVNQISAKIQELEQRYEYITGELFRLSQLHWENENTAGINFKVVLNNVAHLNMFINYEEFVESVECSYTTEEDADVSFDTELQRDLEQLRQLIQENQQNNVYKLSSQVQLKRELKEQVEAVEEDVRQKLFSIVELIREVNAIEKYTTPPNAMQVKSASLDLSLNLGIEKLTNFSVNLQKQSTNQLNSEMRMFGKIQKQYCDRERLKNAKKINELKERIMEQVSELFRSGCQVNSEEGILVKTMTEEAGL